MLGGGEGDAGCQAQEHLEDGGEGLHILGEHEVEHDDDDIGHHGGDNEANGRGENVGKGNVSGLPAQETGDQTAQLIGDAVVAHVEQGLDGGGIEDVRMPLAVGSGNDHQRVGNEIDHDGAVGPHDQDRGQYADEREVYRTVVSDIERQAAAQPAQHGQHRENTDPLSCPGLLGEKEEAPGGMKAEHHSKGADQNHIPGRQGPSRHRLHDFLQQEICRGRPVRCWPPNGRFGSADVEISAAGQDQGNQRGQGHHEFRLFHRIQPPN